MVEGKDYDLFQLLLTQEWEKAKGSLRALIAMKGSTFGEIDDWKELKEKVENFIHEADDEEWFT